MKRIAEDIKTGSFASEYLLYGDERYMLKLYLNRLLGALGASDDNMNYTKIEGKQAEDKIIEICETMPFFADKRVVLIEDSGFFKEKSDKLADYFAKPPEYLIVIFAENAIDKRSRLYKSVAKFDRVIEFKTLDEKDITALVLSELKKNGKKIRKPALETFLNGAGTDYGYISCELEKLISYAGEKEEITEEDIHEICSPQTENRIFDMISDMAAGRKNLALKAYRDLILLKEPPMKMLALMERQFRQLLDIKQLMSMGQGERMIVETLKIHPYAVKKSIPLARKYKESELREMLEEAVRCDEEIKSGLLNDRIAVELLLMR